MEVKNWGLGRRELMHHVGAFTTGEGTVMAQALQGGEEVDLADRIRWASLRMFAKAKTKPGDDEGELFRTMGRNIRSGRLDNLGIPASCLTQIDAALQLLEPFEQFYQGVIFLFDQIRGAASDETEACLADLANAEPIRDAGDAVRKSADELQRTLLTASAVNATTVMEVGAVLKDSGILSLAADVLRETADTCELMRIVLQRHSQVQSGKFDKGLPKGPWARLTNGGDCVQLTAQRYQVSQSQRPAGWKDVGRHPYRTESAFAFIQACNLNVG
jgi:hypothetical protein